MNSTDISTEIKALRQHIQRTADQLAKQPGGADADDGLGTLIYLGNHHDAVPRDLIIDPVLLPEEIVTWMLMKIHVDNPLLATRIPSQDMLMEHLKCSRPIVSRNIQVLRAMRWITLCAEVRGTGGQFRGAVYAQHDTPLSLSETLYLDPGYIDWLEQPVRGDVLKRLQIVKRSVLAHTDHRVIDRGDSLDRPATPLTQIAARLKGQLNDDPLETHLAAPAAAIQAVETGSDSALEQLYRKPAPKPNNPGSADHVKNIDTVKPAQDDHVKDFYMVETQQNSHSHHVKDFYMAENHHVKKIDTVPCSSSSFKNKKTTTTPPTPPSLRFPAAISKSERQMKYARKKLDRLPPDQHQFALDYLADRIKAGKDGLTKPVANPVQYLEWIIKSILAGTLPESSYGLREAPRCGSSSTSAAKGAADDPETARRLFEAHMRSLGAEIDPKTGMAVRVKG